MSFLQKIRTMLAHESTASNEVFTNIVKLFQTEASSEETTLGMLYAMEHTKFWPSHLCFAKTFTKAGAESRLIFRRSDECGNIFFL